MFHKHWHLPLAIAVAATLGACSHPVNENDAVVTPSAAEVVAGIAAPNVIYAGERHDSLGYHRNQLALIRALHEREVPVAIGLEMFQVPFQPVLDEYVSGAIDFETMLQHTEYYTRWKYDVRLYRDIFVYAREHALPMVALNAPYELTDRVSDVGIDGLDAGERAQLPERLTPHAPEYRALLERVYREHADLLDNDIERFVQVQQTWDESMAWSAARYLDDNPDRVMVVLAGLQHVANRYGIPDRLEGHSGIRGVVVLGEPDIEDMPAGAADHYLAVDDSELPPAGRMGVLIQGGDDGALVGGFSDDSPARAAGLLEGDHIVRIDESSVARFADVRLAMWDKKPGDPVRVRVARDEDDATREFDLEFNLY